MPETNINAILTDLDNAINKIIEAEKTAENRDDRLLSKIHRAHGSLLHARADVREISIELRKDKLALK
jgi:hypothetical protein